MRSINLTAAALVAAFAVPSLVLGQQKTPSAEECAKAKNPSGDHAAMDHAAHASLLAACGSALPTQSGQAAFSAISEVVRMLKADPNTDWTRVNIEALRQHLIDMNDVTMNAVVKQRPVAGGLEMEVTGTGNTAGAIKRMAVNHTRMLGQGADYRASAREIANGAVITVTAKDTSNTRLTAQIRGLGFAGMMTEGDHHAPHHLALARGDTSPHGR